MKVLLFVLAIVACVLAENELHEPECTPGTNFYEKCNLCRCSKSGMAVCTKMLCPDKETMYLDETDPKAENTCEPGKIFHVECNWCTCTRDGKTTICTQKLCQKQSNVSH